MRILLLAAALVLGSLSVQADEVPALKSEYLMQIVLETSGAQEIGARRIFPISGGSFSGPGMKGKILAGGADWAKARPDGVTDLDVRITLQTDDGELIYMSYKGVLNRNDGFYWRMTPTFETNSEKHAALNNLVAVGVGGRVDGKTAYTIYKIL